MKHKFPTGNVEQNTSSLPSTTRSGKCATVISWFMGIAIVVLAIFFGPQLKEAFLKVDLIWVSAGLAFYGLNYLLRGFRWQLLTRGAVRWWPEGLHVSCVHGFASYMLPFRTGELALPLILHNLAGLKFSQGTRALIQARLLDVHTLGLWVIVVAFGVDLDLPRNIRFGWVCVGLAMLVAPVILKCLASAGKLIRMPLGRRLSEFVELPAIHWTEWMSSLLIWFAVASVFFCAARAIGLPIGFQQVWLLITLQLPLQLVPFQGIANTGNHEGGWIAGLMLLGFSAEQSIEFSLISHIVLLFYVLALGPVGLLTGRFAATKKEPDAFG